MLKRKNISCLCDSNREKQVILLVIPNEKDAKVSPKDTYLRLKDNDGIILQLKNYQHH